MADDDALPLGKKTTGTKEAMEIEVDVDIKKPPAGESSVFSASLSTVNLVVGVGILYLPATFVKSGLLVATVMCLTVAFFVWYTASLVIRLGHKLGKYSYEEISRVALGKAGYVALCISCILFCWGGNLAYVLSIKSMVAPHFARWTGMKGEMAETLLCLIVIYPVLTLLSLKKNLDALAIVSKIKACVMVITVVVILWTMRLDSTDKYQSLENWTRPQLETLFKDLHDSGIREGESEGDMPWTEDLNHIFGGAAKMKAGGIDDLLDRTRAKCNEPINTIVDGKQETVKVYAHKVYEGLRKLSNRENAKARSIKSWNNDNEVTLNDPQNKKQLVSVWDRFKTYPHIYLWYWQGALLNIGTIMFAFVYHDSAFSVYKQLEEPNISNWKSTSMIALFMITLVQVLFGFLVGANFGISCPDNVLTSDFKEAPVFDPNSKPTIAVQILFSIVLLLTYPGCILIAREYCESLWALWAKSRDGVDEDEADPEPELDDNGEPIPGKYEVSRNTQMIIAFILVAATAPFLFFDKAGAMCEDILDKVGGIACGFMAFVLPSVCFWTVYGFTAGPKEKRSLMDKVLPLVIFIIGCLGCLLKIVEAVDGMAGTELLKKEMPTLPKP